MAYPKPESAMNPHEYDVLEALQRLINHYGRAAIRKDAAPAVFEPDVELRRGAPYDDFVVVSPETWEFMCKHEPFRDVVPTEYPALDKGNRLHDALEALYAAPVLVVDGSPYTAAFTGGATATATDLAALVRAAGLGAEAVGDTVRLSPNYADATLSLPPTPAGPPNRAQRRLRPGKRPPDTSAKDRARLRGPHGGRR